MCLVNKFCPVCGRKGKQASPNWYEWTRGYFKTLHQCVNRNCKGFGKAYVHAKFSWHFPDSSKTNHCNEHDAVAEVIEAHRKGLTVECKSQCPINKKVWNFKIRLYRGC